MSGEPLALAVVLPVCQTCSGDSARELTIVTNLNPYATILTKGWGGSIRDMGQSYPGGTGTAGAIEIAIASSAGAERRGREKGELLIVPNSK